MPTTSAILSGVTAGTAFVSGGVLAANRFKGIPVLTPQQRLIALVTVAVATALFLVVQIARFLMVRGTANNSAALGAGQGLTSSGQSSNALGRQEPFAGRAPAANAAPAALRPAALQAPAAASVPSLKPALHDHTANDGLKPWRRVTFEGDSVDKGIKASSGAVSASTAEPAKPQSSPIPDTHPIQAVLRSGCLDSVTGVNGLKSTAFIQRCIATFACGPVNHPDNFLQEEYFRSAEIDRQREVDNAPRLTPKLSVHAPVVAAAVRAPTARGEVDSTAIPTLTELVKKHEKAIAAAASAPAPRAVVAPAATTHSPAPAPAATLVAASAPSAALASAKAPTSLPDSTAIDAATAAAVAAAEKLLADRKAARALLGLAPAASAVSALNPMAAAAPAAAPVAAMPSSAPAPAKSGRVDPLLVQFPGMQQTPFDLDFGNNVSSASEASGPAAAPAPEADATVSESAAAPIVPAPGAAASNEMTADSLKAAGWRYFGIDLTSPKRVFEKKVKGRSISAREREEIRAARRIAVQEGVAKK